MKTKNGKCIYPYFTVGLHLFDIQYCGAEDTEPGVLERVVLPPWHNPLSFSWHPTDENRLLAISLQGILMMSYLGV